MNFASSPSPQAPIAIGARLDAKTTMIWPILPPALKHIKEAGLSPGLIYGMGGQGGSTQGAGTASGVGLPQDQSVGMGLSAQVS